MATEFDAKRCSLVQLKVQEIEWRCKYAMIACFIGGKPYESKYSA
jgi:hypothetical protein